MSKTSLSVEGMSCEGCERSVETAVKRVEKVTDAKANRFDKNVDIWYEDEIDRTKLIDAIVEIGYEVG